jgi:hypothetical protein
MFHKMSEVRGWRHDEMMSMPKSLFYRYFGYWYIEQLNKEEHYKEQERKQKRDEERKQRQSNPNRWKSL